MPARRGTGPAAPSAPPYASQWGALEANGPRVLSGADPSALVDWAAQGFESAGDYRDWSDRACGVACLQSALGALAPPPPPMAELIDELVAAGAYVVTGAGVEGLIYEPCARLLRARWRLPARVHPHLGVDELRRAVVGGEVVIASVAPEIRWPERPPRTKGGHLVLVYGAVDGSLVFHNPSGLPADLADGGAETARGAVLDDRCFDRFFARRGLAIGGSGEAPSVRPAQPR